MTNLNDTSDTPTKQCTKCGDTYPATTEFWHKIKRGKYGLVSECKPCRNERSRQWRDANPEKARACYRRYRENNREKTLDSGRKYREANREMIRERDRKRYSSNIEKRRTIARNWYWNNRDKALDRKRKYRQANPHKHIEYSRKWRENNSERVRQYRERTREQHRDSRRQWERNNPDKVRIKNHRRRARKANADGSHTAKELREQHKRQKDKCYWCGVKLNGKYHADHVIPLDRGGDNFISNIVCACENCNCSKGAKLPHEWDGTDRLL